MHLSSTLPKKNWVLSAAAAATLLGLALARDANGPVPLKGSAAHARSLLAAPGSSTCELTVCTIEPPLPDPVPTTFLFEKKRRVC